MQRSLASRTLVCLTALAMLTALVPANAHDSHTTESYAMEDQDDGFWSTLEAALFSNEAEAAATVAITAGGKTRTITANGIPDHGTGRFPNSGNPNSISAQSYTFTVPAEPKKAGRTTQVERFPFGIAVNGVLFDPATAEFWNNDRNWNYEALSGKVDLGLDGNNAHVQPNGAYHYHGIPEGLLTRLGAQSAPVLIGYAADGFPIYGPYGYSDPEDAGSGTMELRSGYVLKSGERSGGPGGSYDGTFTADYTFAGGGDLDECNGRTGVTPEYPEGIYHYVITDSFPYVPRCLKGTPDSSFTSIADRRGGGQARRGRGPQHEGRPGPRRGPGRDGRPHRRLRDIPRG